jgi:hypothetical protein
MRKIVWALLALQALFFPKCFLPEATLEVQGLLNMFLQEENALFMTDFKHNYKK